jgi:hypothetical protein
MEECECVRMGKNNNKASGEAKLCLQSGEVATHVSKTPTHTYSVVGDHTQPHHIMLAATGI